MNNESVYTYVHVLCNYYFLQAKESLHKIQRNDIQYVRQSKRLVRHDYQ